MTTTGLLLRNLVWHWRGNALVLLGVFVGTAVLTGALLVGDSLRGSLQDLALEQLGWVDSALVAGRFFREDLAKQMPADKVSPAILLQCSVSTGGSQPVNANKVTILAVDDRFWTADAMPLNKEFWCSEEAAVVVNGTLAQRLGVKAGDKVEMLLQSPDNVPRETLVGKRKTDDVLSQLVVTVKAVQPDTGMGRFTLRPSPEPPLNGFVPLRLIQDKYDPDKAQYPLKGRINAILAGGVSGSLPEAIRKDLTLDDWGLKLRIPADRARDLFKLLAAGEDKWPNWQGKLRKFRWQGRIPDELARLAGVSGELTLQQFVDFFNEQRGYISLESAQVFIEPAVVTAAEKAAAAVGWKSASTFAYMVDTMSAGSKEAAYVIVAALDPCMPAPLGPIQPLTEPPLKDGDILLAQWPGNPLQPMPGQWVTLRYDVPDAQGTLLRHQEKMQFAGWVPLTGAADDPDLTPRFEGITDRLTIRDWASNLPFTVDRRRLKAADNSYWDRYRATPKAYVTLATGQRMWGNRFGQVTSIHFADHAGKDPIERFLKEDLRDAFRIAPFQDALLANLQPADGGFVFDDVKARALVASSGSSPFGMLFLAFSFFLIVAALLLVGLMVRLSLDQRASALGLLLAVGWRRGTVRRLALAEGAILAALGGLLGVGGAVVYAGLLLDLLAVLWPGGLDRSFLRLHVTGESCVIGCGSSFVVSVLTIWWATRVLAKVPPRALLAGETVTTSTTVLSRKRLSVWVSVVAALGAIGCVTAGALAQDHESQAGGFFGSGMLVLTALLAGLWWWMRRNSHGHASAMPGLARLGFRNAARHPVRSMLTVGLLAAATFMVVAVQIFHRDPGRDFLAATGGSGGYGWIGETTMPIFQDPGTPAGRAELRLPADLDARIVPIRLHAGDDASCLNLYQPRQPRLVGVPRSLIARGGFQFAAAEPSATGRPSPNPWQLLLEPRTDGAIPAIGEGNSVTYQLNSGLGQEIPVRDGSGRQVRLRIVALLQDSVFQGELLVADDNFLKLFPRQEGFQFFLIDVPAEANREKVRLQLQAALADYGWAMTPASDRLQSYLDVENTYLATFQALGGLGLLLGTLGLAVVLVRSVWERRGELALLRALGFRQSALGWLVLAENAWLLLLGLAFGCVAALVAVAPFLVSQAGDVLQPNLFALLGLVVIVGLAAGAMAMKMTLRVPLLPALRQE